MAFSQFYATGTISVANGATSVTGSGVTWTAIREGDSLIDPATGARGIIASIEDTSGALTLLDPWPGGSLTSDPYRIVYDSPARRSGVVVSAQVEELVANQTILLSRRADYLVTDALLDTPPGSPTVEDVYLVGTSPSGAWSGKAGYLATWTSAAAWAFTAPEAGMRVVDLSVDPPAFLFRGASSWAIEAVPDSGVVADTYGSAAEVAVLTIGADGRVTAAANAAIQVAFRNRIINGNFAINQRVKSGTVTLTAGSYGHDRWKAGASGCEYTFAISGLDTTITITSGTLVQVIESTFVEGGVYSASWSGTAQARIYQGSPSGSYAAGPLTTGSLTAATATSIEFGTGTVTRVQVEPGALATPFERRDDELRRCLRYYQKSYNYSVAPGTVTAAGCEAIVASNSTNGELKFVSFLGLMRPAPTVVQYSPGTGDSGKVRDETTSADITGNPFSIGDRGYGGITNGVTPTSGRLYRWHWTADAEL